LAYFFNFYLALRRMHMPESVKETVIIVHGTWAAPDPERRRWYEPVDGRPGGEPFPAKLDAALRERGSAAQCWAHCSQGDPIFQWWPGDNSWIARTRAASALASYLTKLRSEGWRCHIVAHSHGGNVLLEALPQINVSPRSFNETQGKLVTLGTPFMDTTSLVTEKLERRRENINATSVILASFMYITFMFFAVRGLFYEFHNLWLNSFWMIAIFLAIAWGLFIGYFIYRRRRRSRLTGSTVNSQAGGRSWISEGSFWIIASFLIGWLLRALYLVFLDVDYLFTCRTTCTDRWSELITNILMAIILISALNLVYHVRSRLGSGVSDKLFLSLDDVNQEKPLMIAIGSRRDETWQVLHHFRKVDNPLAVRASLLGYLFSSMQSAISQNTAVARVLGARSYSDVGKAAKWATALMHLLTFIFLAFGAYQYYHDVLNPGLFGTMFAVIMIVFFLVPLLVIMLVGLTMLLGDSFLSAYFSPIRLFFQLINSLAVVPREIGTYLIRLKSWQIILKIVMGLEGYQFKLPVISQIPNNFPKGLVVYEDMPKGAEQRALDRRSIWIAHHLGDVSETFSKLTVNAADMTSLLRTIEEDQTLVHAAYYTDDECIARIADWIAGRG